MKRVVNQTRKRKLIDAHSFTRYSKGQNLRAQKSHLFRWHRLSKKALFPKAKQGLLIVNGQLDRNSMANFVCRNDLGIKYGA